MKKYTQTHEWIEVNGEIATVGVSDFAQCELGEVVYVELPEENKELEAGGEAAVLESTKAAADVYAPIAGTITEVNSTLEDSPELVNESPEGEGWIFKMKIGDASQLDQLLDEDPQ